MHRPGEAVRSSVDAAAAAASTSAAVHQGRPAAVPGRFDISCGRRRRSSARLPAAARRQMRSVLSTSRHAADAIPQCVFCRLAASTVENLRLSVCSSVRPPVDDAN